MKKFACVMAVMAVMASAPALSQTSPPPLQTTRTIPVTFTGVVANDVTQSIQIRQPNGTFVPYTGPVPDYPYKKGDPVTISFDAEVVNAQAFLPGQPYAGQLSADGTYRFRLGVPNFSSGGGGCGAIAQAGCVTRGVAISGPLRGIGPDFLGEGPVLNMELVYDSKADSYSIDFASRNFGAAFVNTVGYTYNSTTGAFAPCGGSRGCRPIPGADPLEIGIGGNATEVGLNGANGNVRIIDTVTGGVAGLFSLLFSGSWNLPTFGSGGSSGGPTNVPEPSMMLLFGGGVAALMRKRRRKAAAVA